jgi:hypothetical protein
MVSPVRIRAPPLQKVLQIAGKYGAPTVLPEPFVEGVSTAGSRKGLFWRVRGGVLPTVGGVGVEGEDHPDDGVATFCLRTTVRQFLDIPVYGVLRNRPYRYPFLS